MDESLDNFIPVYPDLTKNDSQVVLFSLAEIQENSYKNAREEHIKKGEYFKHQIIGSRVGKFQNRIFILDKPGTGKTCKLTATNELIKDTTNLYKDFYFISISGILPSLKSQIICKCTNEKYVNDKGSDAMKKNDILISGKKPFSANYKMMSYDMFFKNIKDKTVEQLNEEFGYCVFSFDEITEIIINSFSKRETNDMNNSITWTEDINKNIKMLADIKDMNDYRIINSDITYVQYWRFFHAVLTSKVIFASGTPYTNRPSEFLMLVNCLLPLDNQIDVQLYANNIFRYNLKKYERYFNGMFLYVEASSLVPKPTYHGKPLKLSYNVEFPLDDTSDNPQIITKEMKSQIVLYKLELFGFQNQVIYDNKVNIISGKVNISHDQMLCFTDISKRYGSIANNDIQILENLKLPGLQGLYYQMLSCGIYAEIVRIEEERYKKAKLLGLPGPGLYFNYMYLVDTAIGSFIQIFLNAGYEVLYKPEDFRFLNSSSSDYCGNDVVTFTGLPPRKRVVFLTGNIDAQVREKIIQIAGSKHNIHGQYIQFLDGSQVMGIGVNVKTAVGMTRPIGEWNEAKDKQSQDRVFREGGHDYLREYLADMEEKRTGIRPDPASFQINVDLYNFCAFTRHFFIDALYYDKFIDINNINNIPYEVKSLENDPNKKVYSTEYFDGKLSILINPMNITHIVGFCDTGLNLLTGNSIYEYMITAYCKNDSIPHIELSKKFGVDISTDLIHLNSTQKDIIICNSGILYIKSQNDPEYIQFMSGKILLYHVNCEFMNEYMSGQYPNVCYAVKYIDDISNNNKYELYPIHMQYISSTENRYIQLEEKSFGTRRIFRIAKRFAEDCIPNYERTHNYNQQDGTLECDYEECRYKCSYEVLDKNTTKSDTSFLYEENKEFWNNHEILYSQEIIKMCKNEIIAMFTHNTEINIGDIFTQLLQKYKREYFLNMAIYELVSKREKILDRFGFTCYISGNNSILFLRRDFPSFLTSNKKNGGYSKKIIGINTKPDYRRINDHDNDIMDRIESLSINNTIIENAVNNPLLDENSEEKRYFDQILITVTELIKKLNFSSIKILIERSFGRIAYNKVVPDNYKNPKYAIKDVDRIICNILYGIRCIEIIKPEYTFFVHSQPEVKTEAKYNVIKRLKDPSKSNFEGKNGFWVFIFGREGEPTWRPCSENELPILCTEIQSIINDEITKKRTKIFRAINGQDYTYICDYYLSYYESTYRLTKGTFTGEDINSIKVDFLSEFLNWLISSPFINSQLNVDQNTIQRNIAYYNLIVNTADKKERNSYIKQFFAENELIFYYNAPQLDNKVD